MKEKFRDFLCKKAKSVFHGNQWDNMSDELRLSILIKALWQINRECLQNSFEYPSIIMGRGFFKAEGYGITPSKKFYFKAHNNSEIEALEKALEYIFNQD